MSDIVQRLRDSATQARAIDRALLLNEAADEIVKIRREVADMRGGLTDAERRDIKVAADAYAYADHDPDCERIAATLRGLLERLK